MLDHFWMMSHKCNIPTPMWVYAQIADDTNKRQIISYLTPMNLSPTNYGVVRETLNEAIKAATECQEPYRQVDYDLAISKIHFKQQNSESSALQNCFIHLGVF